MNGFWAHYRVSGLEINERPSKRALLDLAKLSLSDSAGKGLVSLGIDVSYLDSPIDGSVSL